MYSSKVQFTFYNLLIYTVLCLDDCFLIVSTDQFKVIAGLVSFFFF